MCEQMSRNVFHFNMHHIIPDVQAVADIIKTTDRLQKKPRERCLQ